MRLYLKIKKLKHITYVITFTCLCLALCFTVKAEYVYKFERMWPTIQQPWYFVMPSDVVVDKNGFVYVVDLINRYIKKFASRGIFVSKWSIYEFDDVSLSNQTFDRKSRITIDDQGFIYVSDTVSLCIKKISSNGELIKKWGEDIILSDIHSDRSNNILVADIKNHQIIKYSNEGRLITKWGGTGNTDGCMYSPQSISTDSENNIYVVETDQNRIQKFDSNGKFIDKLSTGSDLFSPIAIDIDKEDFLYIIEKKQSRSSYRLKKCSKDLSNCETVYASWNEKSKNTHQLRGGLFVDKDGLIYMTDFLGIFILSQNGNIVSRWSATGSCNTFFNAPHAITGNKDKVFIADTLNYRIQKFTQEGQFISSWKRNSNVNPNVLTIDKKIATNTLNNKFLKCFNKDQLFNKLCSYENISSLNIMVPFDLAIDKESNIYVLDSFQSQIQKYSSSGKFISSWGKQGNSEGELYRPEGFTIDNNNYIYICDTYNHRINKYTSNGTFVKSWGKFGFYESEFFYPNAICLDSNNLIYVSDSRNGRIQKFTNEGDYVMSWGQSDDMSDLRYPHGISIDNNDIVYVADASHCLIKIFNEQGRYITKIGTNESSEPGNFSFPMDVYVDNEGTVYVADTGNHRIQKFKKKYITEGTSKAIIIAGGGPYTGNNLWDATQQCANYTYRALTHQGFTKETIYYLSSDTDLDLDSNGKPDDVDDDVANNTIKKAICEWTLKHPIANSLIIYLTDHGGDKKFRLSRTELLSAYRLNEWLNEAQTFISGEIVIVLDACLSGSFVSELQSISDKKRIIITSTSKEESAFFLGSLSFSNLFWSGIFKGGSIGKSFSFASNTISTDLHLNQHPQLDANGNGIENENADKNIANSLNIGNAVKIHGDAPSISEVSPIQKLTDTNSASVYARATDNQGVDRVWAIIRPPYDSSLQYYSTFSDFPSFNLDDSKGSLYQGTYDKFNLPGTYHIAIYAKDRAGNTSSPVVTSVIVKTPSRRKAIILVGNDLSSTDESSIQNIAKISYESMRFQGYSDNDIYFMSSVTFSTGVDCEANLSNLEYAIRDWPKNDINDLVIYLIGNGDENTFVINKEESLHANDLNIWLNELQEHSEKSVIFIYDASYSGTFIQPLASKHKRILITSSKHDQNSSYLSNGDISFSSTFWKNIQNGSNIEQSWLSAKRSMRYMKKLQIPQLDDNGNGIGNEKEDGRLAKNYKIGIGIIKAGGQDPFIGSVSPPHIINNKGASVLWAKDIVAMGEIKKVWAIIVPMDIQNKNDLRPEFNETDLIYTTKTHRYEAMYDQFSNYGKYLVAFYAMDDRNNVSFPLTTTVRQPLDDYEIDDFPDVANQIDINNHKSQIHSFHWSNDEDWMTFNGFHDCIYNIYTDKTSSQCDPVIEIYSNKLNRLLYANDTGIGQNEYILWICPRNDSYFVRMTNNYPKNDTKNSEYQINIDAIGIDGLSINYQEKEELNLNIPELNGFQTDRLSKKQNNFYGLPIKTTLRNQNPDFYSNQLNYSNSSIIVTSIPQYGNRIKNLEGYVARTLSEQNNIIVYIWINGWETKPYKNKPLTEIKDNGSWNCDITTDYNDRLATKIYTFMIPDSYIPPILHNSKRIPEEVFDNAIDHKYITR